MTLGEQIYGRLPVPLQNVAVSTYGFWWRHQRQGGRFREYRAGFLAREWFTAEEWLEWQTRQLREVLALAYQAPYYASAWRELTVDSHELRSVTPADLRTFPLLGKEDVRRDPKAFCPGGKPGSRTAPFYTSGSTGTPLTIYHSNDDLRRGLAIRDARYFGFLGVNHRMPHATIKGRVVVPDPDSPGPYHRTNLAERQTYFSPYHLSSHTARAYIEALRKSGAVWIDGYASSVHDLAFFALEQGIDCPPLRAIVTMAEPSTPRLKEDVARAFGCRATQDYGLVEEAVMALECEHGSLHVFPDSGFVEIVNESGESCGPGEIGEIVATSFVRLAQPFVRYRTGDLAAWSEQQACPCGRNMPIFETIEGRLDDVIVGADGRRLGRLSTIPKHLPGIVSTQFVQERPGHVLVRVVAEGRLEPGVEEELRRRLVTRLGAGMEIDVQQVDSLERTSRGKIRAVVSSVAQRR